MNIQLVHSSVLTVPHFVKNALSGITTVILCETTDAVDAHNFICSFIAKVQQNLPMLNSKGHVACYCYKSEQKINTRKLYSNLRSYLTQHPNQEIIRSNPEWQH